MKKVLFLFAVFTASFVMAQDLPTDPEPGKCYVRCTTPDVYVNETVTLTIKPAYKVLKTVPATFKTVTERVLVKEEGKNWLLFQLSGVLKPLLTFQKKAEIL